MHNQQPLAAMCRARSTTHGVTDARHSRPSLCLTHRRNTASCRGPCTSQTSKRGKSKRLPNFHGKTGMLLLFFKGAWMPDAHICFARPRRSVRESRPPLLIESYFLCCWRLGCGTLSVAKMDQDGLFLMLKMCNGCSHNKVSRRADERVEGAGFRSQKFGQQSGSFDSCTSCVGRGHMTSRRPSWSRVIFSEVQRIVVGCLFARAVSARFSAKLSW